MVETIQLHPPEYGLWPNATLKLFVTKACNLTCTGCFNESNLRYITRPDLRDHVAHLSSDEIVQVMVDARRSFDTYAVEFSGGEPTLDPNVPSYIQTAKDMGYVTRLTTNGTIFGATGAYRTQLEQFLPPPLQQLSGDELLTQYLEAGLDRVTVSIDTMHTMTDDEFRPDMTIAPRAPVSVVAATLRSLLEHGMGLYRGDKSMLDRYGIQVNMTASGRDYEPSRALVEEVMSQVGAQPQWKKGQTLPKEWKTSDGQVIKLHRLEAAAIGYGNRVDNTAYKGLEDLFGRNCFDFVPRSRSKLPERRNQEIAVNYDGNVYNCAMQSFPFGNIRKFSLSEIVAQVNTGTTHPEYATGAGMFMEIMGIAKESDGAKGWGEAYRRILAMDPSKEAEIRALQSHSGGCYALGHSPEYLALLGEYRQQHTKN